MYNFAYVFYLSFPGPIVLVTGHSYNWFVILYAVACFFLHLSEDVLWNCLLRHQLFVVETALNLDHLVKRYPREGENHDHTSFFLRRKKPGYND